MKKNQFGIQALFLLMVVTALTIVVCQFAMTHKDETLVYSMLFSGISAMVGVAMILLSVLFSIGVVLTDSISPMRKYKLQECFHMLVFGMIGVAPAVLFAALVIYR